ncbi:MAG: hypothetical protein V2J12_07580 [Gammaproteobacteria bacterium]|jgi:hypothetical protein|nr:hypothetical protein [Gammaproteobacteria bacterium]
MTQLSLAARETAARPSSSTLGMLNRRFHERLAEARSDELARIHDGEVPVVLRIDDRLLVAVGSSVTIAAINGAEYHILKALAHLPVLAHLESVSRQNPASAGLTVDLEHYDQFLRDRSISVSQFRYLTDKLAQRSLTNDEHMDLAAIQKCLISLAAENEVANLVDALLQVKTKLIEGSMWQRTHFVIYGGNQPRYKHLSKNFFKRLLTEQTKSEGAAIHRVIYSETCDTLDAAKDLVADRLVNGRLANVFMDSPLSLDADVLGDAGLEAIDRCFADGRARCLL